MDFLPDPDPPARNFFSSLDSFGGSGDELCTNQFTCGTSNTLGNVAISVKVITAFARHLIYFYTHSDPWSVAWMLWIIGMIIITLDTLRIFRNGVVIMKQISSYDETRVGRWKYLEQNAYRLQAEYQQNDCPICSRNFVRGIIQSILFCGDRFCRDCINRHEGRRWDNHQDGPLYYRWTECPVCETPYDIISMKFPFSWDRYDGFWSIQLVVKDLRSDVCLARMPSMANKMTKHQSNRCNQNAPWTALSPAPDVSLSNLVQLNADEFLVAISNHKEEGIVTPGVYKYSIQNDTWSLVSCFNCFVEFKFGSIALDDRNMKLYLLGRDPVLNILDLNSSPYHYAINDLDCKSAKFHAASTVILRDDCSYHIVGGHHNPRHCRWNETTLEFEVIHEFETWTKGNLCSGLVHIRSQRRLICFGGYDCTQIHGGDRDLNLDEIWNFDIEKSEWTLMDQRLPLRMNSFGFLLTEDERYIILFGGESMDIDLDAIWIWNLQSMEFTESKITCPVIGGFRVQMVSDMEREMHLVSGFLRLECCSESKNSTIQIVHQEKSREIEDGVCTSGLPKDVVLVVAKHFMCIDIYVLHHWDGCTLWKIGIEEIIPSYVPQALQKVI